LLKVKTYLSLLQIFSSASLWRNHVMIYCYLDKFQTIRDIDKIPLQSNNNLSPLRKGPNKI
jgi:hypothetical protein